MKQQPSLPQLLLPPPSPAEQEVQVRCAGCRMILTVGPGLTEFLCPTCQLPQMLPSELLNRVHQHHPNNHKQPQRPNKTPRPQAHGIDPTKMQLPCTSCKAILNVPHGLAGFNFPQCNVELAVDLSKIKQLIPSRSPTEEVNEAHQSHKRLRVVRIETTTDSQRIVGLMVPNAAVKSVLQDLAWVQEIDD